MSCSIQFAEAKLDFQKGLLTKYEIIRQPLADEYTVRVITTYDGWKDLVDARSGHPRIFKTIDTAISVLRRIGFKGFVLSGV